MVNNIAKKLILFVYLHIEVGGKLSMLMFALSKRKIDTEPYRLRCLRGNLVC